MFYSKNLNLYKEMFLTSIDNRTVIKDDLERTLQEERTTLENTAKKLNLNFVDLNLE